MPAYPLDFYMLYIKNGPALHVQRTGPFCYFNRLFRYYFTVTADVSVRFKRISSDGLSG